MKKTIELVMNLSFMGLLAFLPVFNVWALEASNPINEYDSLYRYNALENKISFYNFQNNKVLLPDLGKVIEKTEGILLLSNKSQEDIAKKLQNIIEKQNLSITQIDSAINVLKDGNVLKIFFVGSDLGILRFQLVQRQ